MLARGQFLAINSGCPIERSRKSHDGEEVTYAKQVLR